MSKPKPNLEAGEKAMKRLLAMATTEEAKLLIPIFRRAVMAKCNELEACPFCSSPISDTTYTYTDETAKKTIEILLRWCDLKGRHEFKTSDIKDLLDHTQYANLNHLVSFGGIVYRPKNPKTGKQYTSTHYGIHRQRAEEFLKSMRDIPVQIKRNRFTRERVGTAEGIAGDLPHVSDLIDGDGRFVQPALT